MGLVLLILLAALPSLGAAPDTLWTRLYGGSSWDNAVGGVPDQSGGFVLAGQTQSYGPAGQNGYLVRTYALSGDTVFARWYGGSASDVFSDVQVTPARMLAVGSTSSYGSNPQNAWLVCTNALGDTVWTRTLDLGGSEAALAVDYGVDYFVVGYSWPAGGQPDLMVSKVTDTGTPLWTSTLGGSGIDWAYDVLALSDGGCVVVAETYNFGVGAPPYSNAWLVRYDAAGDTLWTKTYGDSAAYDRANAIIATVDGGFAIVGYRESAGDQDVLLLKTDASGVLEWSRTYGGSGDDGGLDLVSPCDDGYFIGGYTQSYGAGGNDVYLLRTDATGDTVWTAVYGGTNSDLCYAVAEGCSPFYHDGYYAAGATQSGSSGPQDAWLIRVDGDPLIVITDPAACQEFVIGDQVSVQWFTQGTGTYSYVRVELNRDYPAGSWESIADSIYNAGFTQFTATAPASPRCAVRVTKLGGSPTSDVSELFSIRPPGNFASPSVVWDSTYNGGAGLGHVITTSDGKYASNYGRSIIKRDSVGGELWTALFTFDNMLWTDPNSFAITELSNGDLVAVGVIDTIELTAHRPRMITLRADAGGTPAGSMGISMLDDQATTGRDVITDEAGDGFWALADVYYPNIASYAGVYRVPAGGGGWSRRIQEVEMDARCCETADNDGLLIAGEIGDYFANTRDLFLLRLDSDGDTLWTRSYDFGQNEVISDIHRLATGGYVIAGHSFPYLGSSTDYLIVMLDRDGNLLQQWNYDRQYHDYVGGVTEDLDGRIVLAGVSQPLSQPSVAQLIKFGCDSSVVWNQTWTHGDGQGFSDVDLAPGGGYIVSGYRTIPSGGGGFATRPVLTKYGAETWTVPTCSPVDSLVIQHNPSIPANVLTWKGDETGVYYIFSKADFDTTHGGGAGWSLLGCVEPSPPARSSFSYTDTDLTPGRKFYYVVHDCNGSCGGGED